MSNRYSAIVIGCGRIGTSFDYDKQLRGFTYSHAGAYKANTNRVDLINLCDIDEEKAKKAALHFDISYTTKDYKQTLRSLKPNIVSICTKPEERLEIIEECIANKVQAIYCEKPLADTIENATKIYELIKNSKTIFVINHQRRFSMFYNKMRNILNDDFGRIQNVIGYYTGGLANNGSHLIDLVRMFFGDCSSFYGTYSNNLSHNEQDKNIDCRVTFDSGIVANLFGCNGTAFGILEVQVMSEKHRIVIKNAPYINPETNETYFRIENVTNNSRFENAKQLFSLQDYQYDKFCVSSAHIINDEYMINAVKHIVDCLDEKTKNNISNIDDAIKIMTAITELNKSAAENHRITSDE